MGEQVELYNMREPSKSNISHRQRAFRSLSTMSQKVRIHPLVLLVSYTAWRREYPHLNHILSESAVCLVFLEISKLDTKAKADVEWHNVCHRRRIHETVLRVSYLVYEEPRNCQVSNSFCLFTCETKEHADGRYMHMIHHGQKPLSSEA